MPSPAPLTESLPAELRARYEPVALLGKGGMGVVLRCRDRDLERPVAIKVMRFGREDARMQARFDREVQALGALEHPGVLRVFDSGRSPEGPYLVTEYLDGADLEAGVASAEALGVMTRVAEALQAVHDAGLVHRDLKPANVIRTRSGRVVLIDFGLVHDPDSTRLTRTGVAVGTLGFMAPEVLAGEAVTPAADWFAWGATCQVLATGVLPYTARDLQRFLAGKGDLRPDLGGLDPTGALAGLLGRCLAADPAARPRDLGEVREALAEVATVPIPRRQVAAALAAAKVGATDPVAGTPRPRGGRARLAALGAAAAAVVGGVLLTRGGPPGSVVPASALPVAARIREEPEDPVVAMLARFPAELTDAAGKRIGPRGAVLPGDGIEPPAGSWVLLDRDPAYGAMRLSHLGVYQEFLDWLAAGGRPELLGPDARGALVAADELLAREGLDPAFHPYLAEPAREEIEIPAPIRTAVATWRDDPDLGPLPARTRGWLGRFVLDLGAMHRIQAELEEETREPGRVDEILEVPSDTLGFGTFTVRKGMRDVLMAGLVTREARIASHRWSRPFRLRGARALYAACRSARDEPATAGVLAQLFRVHWTLLKLGVWATVAPGSLRAYLPGGPQGVLEAGLEVAILEGAQAYRPWQVDAAQRTALMERILEGARRMAEGRAEGPALRALKSWGHEVFSRRTTRPGDYAEVAGWIRQVARGERELAPSSGCRIAYEQAKAAVARGELAPLGPAERAWILATLEGEVAGLSDSQLRKLPNVVMGFRPLE